MSIYREVRTSGCWRTAAAMRLLCASLLCAGSLTWGGPAAQAQTVAPATAEELALAMGVPSGDLLSATLSSSDPDGVGIGTGAIGAFFPTDGNTFAILSSGLAASAPTPNDSGSLSASLGGLNNSQGNDLVQLSLMLQVPPGATCLGVDFAFYSEEFPEFVGSSFNDGFTAEAGGTDIQLSGNDIVAPLNFAFDPDGNVISVNTVFGFDLDTGTTYDGATPLLRAITPIAPGTTTLEIVFTIQDLGDSIFDSAVFLDNFAWAFELGCEAGAQPANCAPPTFEAPTPDNDSILFVQMDNPLTFTVQVADAEPSETVTLSVEGLPAGATMTPALPSMGNPVTSDFAWTPTAAELGAHTLVFKATDDCDSSVLLEAVRTITIEVVEEVAAVITWLEPPPADLTGGLPFDVAWHLANFSGTITENQAHFGITSVLGSSNIKPGVQGAHSHTFTAPNVGEIDSPTTFKYVARAMDDTAEVLSPVVESSVSVGPHPPTVTWIAPPPPIVQQGTSFPVEWEVSNYQDPADVITVVWGVTKVVAQTPNQPGGNGTYAATVPVPTVAQDGTLFYTAVAANGIEFAFAPVMPVKISTRAPTPAATLFPTGPGSRWLYKQNAAREVEVTIAPGTFDIAGAATVRFDDSDGGQEFWTNGAGLRVHREIAASTNTRRTYNPPYVVARALLFPNDTVTSDGLVETASPAGLPETRPYTAAFTVEGSETLTVKAGTFEVVRLRGTINIAGEAARTVTVWLAPGVGRVRSVDTAMGDRSLIGTNLP